MTNSENLFADELIKWLIESGFNKPQCQMSINYKYAPYGKKIAVLSYGDKYVYWYPSETLEKWFVETISYLFFKGVDIPTISLYFQDIIPYAQKS